jgi:hypothetical protein
MRDAASWSNKSCVIAAFFSARSRSRCASRSSPAAAAASRLLIAQSLSPFADDVADLHAEIDDLAGDRDEHARHAVLVELDLARDREVAGQLVLGDRIDLDRREHLLVDHERGVGLRRRRLLV